MSLVGIAMLLANSRTLAFVKNPKSYHPKPRQNTGGRSVRFSTGSGRRFESKMRSCLCASKGANTILEEQHEYFGLRQFANMIHLLLRTQPLCHGSD